MVAILFQSVQAKMAAWYDENGDMTLFPEEECAVIGGGGKGSNYDVCYRTQEEYDAFLA